MADRDPQGADLSTKSRDELIKELTSIREALEAISDGFIVFDADDHVVTYNTKQLELFPSVANKLAPGLAYRELLRAQIRSGQMSVPPDQEEAWLDQRIARHKSASEPLEQVFADGRIIRLSEYPTASGDIVAIRSDITELKRAQEDARARADQLRVITDAAPASIAYIDRNQRMVFANRTAEIWFERSQAELLGRTTGELLGPENYEKVRPHIEAVLEGQTQRFETQIDYPDGHSRYLDYSYIPDLHEDGSVQGYFGLVSDITAFKEHEEALRRHKDELEERVERRTEALRASENKLRDLIDGSLQGIMVHRDMKALFINDTFAEMYGYTAAEIVALDSIDVLSAPSELERQSDFHQARMAGKPAPEHYEFQGQRKDGSLFWAQTRVRLVEWEGETAAQSTLVDLTDQKLAEKEAALAQERMLDAIESTGDGFVLYDADDRLVMCNEIYRGYYHETAHLMVPGAQFEDMLRAGAEMGQFPAAVGRVDDWVAARMVNHLAANTEIEQQLADGRWLRISERRTGDGGIVGFRVDITDLKKAQEAAEQASRAKSLFLSSMSHELRTPLNSILGFGQILETDGDEPLSEDQQESLGHILRGGQHLLNLINEVLDLSRIETGQVEVSIEDVNVAEIVSQCRAMAETLAKDREIDIAVVFNDLEDRMIRADTTRLRQVLLNLLSNAIKYNRQSGSVTIASELQSDRKLRISISDTGGGIPYDVQHQVFEPFERLNAENTGIEGTGIGMTISKMLIDLMDGSIGFESEVGVGSKFWVELSMSDAVLSQMTAGVETNDVATPDGQAIRTLLYIEDNPANLILMEKIIARSPNLRLVSSETAELGISLAQNIQPCLILMDINLPGINGFEALKHLKQRPVTAQIPVIAVTANALPADVTRGLESGFKAYLTKPLMIDNVLETIVRVLEPSP